MWKKIIDSKIWIDVFSIEIGQNMINPRGLSVVMKNSLLSSDLSMENGILHQSF